MKKKLQNLSKQGLSFVCFWLTVYPSALVPRNLRCLEKSLVECLHEEITLEPMSQINEKCDSLILSRSYLWMVWICHGIPRAHRYNFCLEPTARKDTCMRTAFVTVMVILFENSILKLLYHSYVQSYFSRITRHIETNILKDTLQLNNLRTWINIGAKYFIKTLVCNMN